MDTIGKSMHINPNTHRQNTLKIPSINLSTADGSLLLNVAVHVVSL